MKKVNAALLVVPVVAMMVSGCGNREKIESRQVSAISATVSSFEPLGHVDLKRIPTKDLAELTYLQEHRWWVREENTQIVGSDKLNEYDLRIETEPEFVARYKVTLTNSEDPKIVGFHPTEAELSLKANLVARHGMSNLEFWMQDKGNLPYMVFTGMRIYQVSEREFWERCAKEIDSGKMAVPIRSGENFDGIVGHQIDKLGLVENSIVIWIMREDDKIVTHWQGLNRYRQHKIGAKILTAERLKQIWLER